MALKTYSDQNFLSLHSQFLTNLLLHHAAKMQCVRKQLDSQNSSLIPATLSEYFPDPNCSQESGLVPVRLTYSPALLPTSWSWPLEDTEVEDQGWCHNSWLVAALETAAQR